MHPSDSTLRAFRTIHRTVVVVDLVGYSTVARVLEEHTSAVSVFELNRLIQDFVKEALSSVPPAAYSLLSETGDGAILLFENAGQAHTFAERLHQNSERHNTTRTESSAHRLFRIGIATGEIVLDGDEAKFGYAGVTIANAVRLESAARPGEIVIDAGTFQALPMSIRASYSDEGTVLGKREEVFRVRKYMAVTVHAREPEVLRPAGVRVSQRLLRFKSVLWLGVALVVLLGVSLAVWRFYPRVQPFSSISTEQLTDSGDITGVAISPDGNTLAEVKSSSGQHSIWIRNISTGKDLQILSPVPLEYGTLIFSKDGNELYFVRQDADSSVSYTLYSLPVFGGQPRLLSRNSGPKVCLSPNEQRIAFIKNLTSASEVHIVDLANGEDKMIAKVEGHRLSSAAWSPDGLTLAWVVSNDPFQEREKVNYSIGPTITLLKVSSMNKRDVSLVSLPPNFAGVSQLIWLPSGKEILLTFSKTYSGVRSPGDQIGLVSIDYGTFRQIRDDMMAHSEIAVSADGMSVATLIQQSISEVDFYNASGTQVSATTRIPRSAEGIVWLSEDKLLLDIFDPKILSRDNGQFTDLNVMLPRSIDESSKWTSNMSNTNPAACPDGSLIFTGALNKVDQLYLVDSHGQFVRALVKIHGADMFCSPEDKFAYYSVPDAEDLSIWRVPLAGGAPSKVMSITHVSPIVYSNDGKFAAYVTDSEGRSKATIIDLNQRTVVGDLPLNNHAPGTLARFTQDGTALTFVEQQNQGFALASQPINGSAPRTITTWFRSPISDFAWSPSGKFLAILWDRSTSDVELIKDRADKRRD